jgi:glycerophosphoryl diester phosphodiesterase
VRLGDLMKTGARIAVWNRRVSKRGVQKAQKRGLHVWVYTVNDAQLARRLTSIGISGIITNEIAAVARAL